MPRLVRFEKYAFDLDRVYAAEGSKSDQGDIKKVRIWLDLPDAGTEPLIVIDELGAAHALWSYLFPSASPRGEKPRVDLVLIDDVFAIAKDRIALVRFGGDYTRWVSATVTIVLRGPDRTVELEIPTAVVNSFRNVFEQISVDQRYR